MPNVSKKKLRSGFTTGTSAAAAAKGALLYLLNGIKPDYVTLCLLTGDDINVPIKSSLKIDLCTARCTVIKDAGDDPDITHKAEIGALVTILYKGNIFQKVNINGGPGVGTVTKPGLEVAPGNPAINQGPRKMITQAVCSTLKDYNIRGSVRVEIFVPLGKKLSKKTLNARLGILGGISILGTTGIVQPLSHEAYTATIGSAISVAKALGINEVVFTTGRRTERLSQNRYDHLHEESFIQIGDYFKVSLEKAAQQAIKKIHITVFFGKALKMAHKTAYTHAKSSSLSLDKLSKWAYETTQKDSFAKRILEANTARHAFEIIHQEHPPLIDLVGNKMVESAKSFAGPHVEIVGVIYGFDGEVFYDSNMVNK